MSIRHVSPLRAESGQSHLLALGLLLPVYLAVVMALFAFCWVGYQVVAFDRSIGQASWTLDSAKLDHALAGGPNAQSDAIVDALSAPGLGVDRDSLSVTSARMTESTKKHTHELTDESDNEVLHIERITSTERIAHVMADVSYRIKLPVALFGIDGVTVARHIDKRQPIVSRIEVS